MKKFFAALFAVTFLFATQAMADGKAAAEKQVKDAIAYAKANGKDKAVAEINKGMFRDGELYVTVYTLDGKCLAHPVKATQVGQNLMDSKDPDGVPFVAERVKIAKEKGSGWQTYKFMNPVSKKIEPKEVYNEKFEDLIFSAGAYEKK
jgi:cytochrome c